MVHKVGAVALTAFLLSVGKLSLGAQGGGVGFKLDSLDAEGNVRICFFYDPDGRCWS